MISKGKKKTKMTKDEVTEIMSQVVTPLSLYLVPTNLEEEKDNFFDSFDYSPQFKYRKVVNKNAQVFEKLNTVNEITDIDPEISKFIIKVIKHKKQAADLLGAIGSDEKFIRISHDRFGLPMYSLFRRACMVLRCNYNEFSLVETNERLRKKVFEFEELVPIFEKTFEILGLDGWTVDKSKAIISSGFRTLVKTKRVVVDPGIKISAEKLRKTIIHEVATHALRGHNGFMTGYEVFGKPNLIEYLDDEEGLAVYNEEKYGVLKGFHLRKMAGYVYAVYLGQDFSFRDTFNAIRGIFPRKTAFDIVYRVKRGISDTSQGGCYSKDIVYFRGFLKVRKKLQNDAVSYRNMYAGKIPMDYLYLVEEGIIPKPKVVPSKELIEKIFDESGIA